MELDTGAELDAPGRVVDLLPRLGQAGPDLELLVAVGQEFVDETVDVVRKDFVLRMRVGGLHIAAIRPAQCLRIDGALGGDQRNNTANGGNGQDTHGSSFSIFQS